MVNNEEFAIDDTAKVKAADHGIFDIPDLGFIYSVILKLNNIVRIFLEEEKLLKVLSYKNSVIIFHTNRYFDKIIYN